MGVRNCKEIGENLQKIVKRLMSNDKLVNLLYYTGSNPFDQTVLSDSQKNTLIFNKLITIVPSIDVKNTAQSVVAIYVNQGSQLSDNTEFRNITLTCSVFVPLTQWFIKDSNLRIFSILGEIQESLNGKTVNGLGKLQGGDFVFVGATDDICEYQATYMITTYD